jgi:hypothetical protein
LGALGGGGVLARLGGRGRAGRTGATAERVGHGEALEAVAALGLLADNVKDGVDQLGALGVVALGPVVAGARLAEDEVVRAEDLAEGARADGVHGARLEVHEDVAGHVAAARRLVVVHVDALQLEVCAEHEMTAAQGRQVRGDAPWLTRAVRQRWCGSLPSRAHRSRRGRCRSGQCRAHRRQPPRTWHRSGCRTGHPG